MRCSGYNCFCGTCCLPFCSGVTTAQITLTLHTTVLYAREFPNLVSVVGSSFTRIIPRLKWRRRIRISWVFHRSVCEARVSIRAVRFRKFSSAWFSDLSGEAGLLFACAESLLLASLLCHIETSYFAISTTREHPPEHQRNLDCAAPRIKARTPANA